MNLKIRLERLGLKQHQFAKLVGVTPRTVSLWVTGETQVPGPAWAYLRVLEMLSDEARENELSRIERKDQMLDEGLYRVNYRGDVSFGSATVVMRSGKVFGTDVAGGVYEGTYDYDEATGLNHVGVSMKVPPNAQLVTGLNAGPMGATIPIVASFKRPTPTAKSTISVAGRNVEMEITFVGPLPS